MRGLPTVTSGGCLGGVWLAAVQVLVQDVREVLDTVVAATPEVTQTDRPAVVQYLRPSLQWPLLLSQSPSIRPQEALLQHLRSPSTDQSRMGK